MENEEMMENEQIKENPKIYPCPVCGSPNQLDGEGTDDTCQVCGWTDDGYQRLYPDDTGANCKLTLNMAKKLWKSGKTIKVYFPNPREKESHGK